MKGQQQSSAASSWAQEASGPMWLPQGINTCKSSCEGVRGGGKVRFAFDSAAAVERRLYLSAGGGGVGQSGCLREQVPVRT